MLKTYTLLNLIRLCSAALYAVVFMYITVSCTIGVNAIRLVIETVRAEDVRVLRGELCVLCSRRGAE